MWLENTIRNFEAHQINCGCTKKELKEVRVSEIFNKRRNENLPKAITFPQFTFITAYVDDGEEEEEDAEQCLRKFASVSGSDKTFGLRDKDGKFYIGNKERKIKE